jgi:hypothetical protein
MFSQSWSGVRCILLSLHQPPDLLDCPIEISWILRVKSMHIYVTNPLVNLCLKS